ncbi:MAG: 4-(cytidine 5'-diphospho)-2-C-methyl-D-erythritol kinase [Xanthobacteraceae bacterium]
MPASLVEDAPAKVNLTLRVLGRRADGYHEIESLVAFAGVGDRLSFAPGGALALNVRGPSAAQAGATADNLVLKAAGALADRLPTVGAGTFDLEKRLPVAAGLGGGSTDAAAALRLLARTNNLAPDDPLLYAAARATGADVPVCLDPRTRLMRGIGEVLFGPFTLPPLQGVLVNPGVALETKAVFARWKPLATPLVPADLTVLTAMTKRDQLVRFLLSQANDLESVAIALAPVVADVLLALSSQPRCELARMSGSGATCFAVFASAAAAIKAAEAIHAEYPTWWVRATALGGANIPLPLVGRGRGGGREVTRKR